MIKTGGLQIQLQSKFALKNAIPKYLKNKTIQNGLIPFKDNFFNSSIKYFQMYLPPKKISSSQKFSMFHLLWWLGVKSDIYVLYDRLSHKQKLHFTYLFRYLV